MGYYVINHCSVCGEEGGLWDSKIIDEERYSVCTLCKDRVLVDLIWAHLEGRDWLKRPEKEV